MINKLDEDADLQSITIPGKQWKMFNHKVQKQQEFITLFYHVGAFW